MENTSKGFSLDFMADYYDALTLGERSRFRQRQVKLMGLQKGERILEVGCGTGTLSILSKLVLKDECEVFGLDIAPRMVDRAREKANSMNLDISFITGSVDKIPFPDNSFSLVVSSLMFHHLPVDLKKSALGEIHRVLKSGGRLFFCDFGKPEWYVYPLSFLMLVWLSSTRFQLMGRLPELLSLFDFSDIQPVGKGVFLDYFLVVK